MIGLNAETEIKQFRLPQHKMQVMQRTDKTRSVFYLHIHKLRRNKCFCVILPHIVSLKAYTPIHL